MGITVSDCLKLPALREAKVLAGHKGLNKIVSNVSVLEYAGASALESQLFVGNAMIISALVSVKDSIDDQCKVITHLSKSGEVCLILYYVGIYLPRVDEKLIKAADELDFPLIIMPPNRYNHRYSEAITEVVTAILNDQKQETDLVTSILDRVSQHKEELRTVSVVLRMLSDRLRCSMMLTDRHGSKLAFVAWPMASQWEEDDLNAVIDMRNTLGGQTTMVIQGRTMHISSIPFDTETRKGIFLISIDESSIVNSHYLRQSVEALQLFVSIWHYDFANEGPDALVRAILSNQPVEMQRIAQNLHIDVAFISNMWILIDRNKYDGKEKRRQAGERHAAMLTSYLVSYHKTLLVDVFENYVVAFMDPPHQMALSSELCKFFIKEAGEADEDLILVSCENLHTTADVRSAYTLMEESIDTVFKIFPHLRVITFNELKFAGKCRDIASQGEEFLYRHISPLNPILKTENGEAIADTLAAFLLDHGSSVQKCADNMYIHKNTVKYRLQKAKACLGHEVTKMPEMMELYLALALLRVVTAPSSDACSGI